MGNIAHKKIQTLSFYRDSIREGRFTAHGKSVSGLLWVPVYRGPHKIPHIRAHAT